MELVTKLINGVGFQYFTQFSLSLLITYFHEQMHTSLYVNNNAAQICKLEMGS